MKPTFTGPALGLLELESIARGIVVSDALVKRAAVHLAITEAVTPGKYLIVFTGDVAETEEAFAAGLEAAGPLVVDRLLLPAVSDAIPQALNGQFGHMAADDSVGVVETHTVAAALLAADAALKRAQVRLTHLAVAKGIGGKGWFLIAGAQDAVEAALEGVGAALPAHHLVATELISRPHRELRGRTLP